MQESKFSNKRICLPNNPPSQQFDVNEVHIQYAHQHIMSLLNRYQGS